MKFFRQIGISDELYKYIIDVSVREEEVLKKLRTETYEAKTQDMQSSPEQANLLCFLANLIDAKKILEVGVHKGYSTLALAIKTAGDVAITGCEKNIEWASVANKYWKEAGFEKKITLILGDALASMTKILESEGAGFYDMIFIDADKKNYINYYELSLKLVRKNGLIIIDNTLWHGDVINANSRDERTHIIVSLNKLIKGDERVEVCLIPMRDGISLLRKK